MRRGLPQPGSSLLGYARGAGSPTRRTDRCRQRQAGDARRRTAALDGWRPRSDALTESRALPRGDRAAGATTRHSRAPPLIVRGRPHGVSRRAARTPWTLRRSTSSRRGSGGTVDETCCARGAGRHHPARCAARRRPPTIVRRDAGRDGARAAATLAMIDVAPPLAQLSGRAHSRARLPSRRRPRPGSAGRRAVIVRTAARLVERCGLRTWSTARVSGCGRAATARRASVLAVLRLLGIWLACSRAPGSGAVARHDAAQPSRRSAARRSVGGARRRRRSVGLPTSRIARRSASGSCCSPTRSSSSRRRSHRLRRAGPLRLSRGAARAHAGMGAARRACRSRRDFPTSARRPRRGPRRLAAVPRRDRSRRRITPSSPTRARSSRSTPAPPGATPRRAAGRPALFPSARRSASPIT